MFINPALAKFQNGPDPADENVATAADAVAPTLRADALDLERFALGNGLGHDPGTMRQDPFGAAADRDKDICTGICGSVGIGVGIGLSVATSTEIGIDGWISMGAAVGTVAANFICTDGMFTPDKPSAEPRDTADIMTPGRDSGAPTDSSAPPAPPANDDSNTVGGFTSSSGAPESNAGNTDTSGNMSTQPTPPADDTNSSTDGSSDDDGRVGGSNGEGDMPADDATVGGYNPRVADFGDVSTVALALQAALLNQANTSPDAIGSIAAFGLGVRA